MTAEVKMFPEWKKANVSAEDRLMELASIARQYPEQFANFVIVYRENKANGQYQVRHFEFGCDLFEGVGLCELGKFEYMKAAQT